MADAMSLLLFANHTNGPTKREVLPRSNPFEEYDEKKFRERFRLSKVVVWKLLEQVCIRNPVFQAIVYKIRSTQVKFIDVCDQKRKLQYGKPLALKVPRTNERSGRTEKEKHIILKQTAQGIKSLSKLQFQYNFVHVGNVGELQLVPCTFAVVGCP